MVRTGNLRPSDSNRRLRTLRRWTWMPGNPKPKTRNPKPGRAVSCQPVSCMLLFLHSALRTQRSAFPWRGQDLTPCARTTGPDADTSGAVAILVNGEPSWFVLRLPPHRRPVLLCEESLNCAYVMARRSIGCAYIEAAPLQKEGFD